jgi:opacity protein-like surface antigen
MKTALLALVAMLCLTFVASAADISGKWTVDASAAPAAPAAGQGRGGGMGAGTYEFKVSGATLTGSITRAGRGGDPMVTPIADGKITGDTLSFTTTLSFNGNDFKSTYTGKIVGDKIELTVDNGRGNPRTMTLKKGE